MCEMISPKVSTSWLISANLGWSGGKLKAVEQGCKDFRIIYLYVELYAVTP